MYRIVRFFKDRPDGVHRRVIKSGLTLEEAQRHCKDRETSSRTCTRSAGKQRTRIYGEWFDGYEET